MVERDFVKIVVAGSSPTIATKLSKKTYYPSCYKQVFVKFPAIEFLIQ